MNQFMIDLETLSQRPNAPILSVGAAKFNIYTGEIGQTFYRAIDIESACQHGVPTGSTIKWWLEQGDAARKSAVAGTCPLPVALEDLRSCYADWSNVEVFANGPSFDVTILDYAYHKVFGKESPWKFWNVRDCRTVAMIAGKRPPKLVGGVAHNALDDAIHQAKWVSEFFAQIKWPGAARKPNDNTALDDL